MSPRLDDPEYLWGPALGSALAWLVVVGVLGLLVMARGCGF